MEQPILILRPDCDPSEGLCAEVLRCEGFPWLEERPAGEFDGVPPGVSVVILAGSGVSRNTAERLAGAVSEGVSLIATAPDPALAAAFDVAVSIAVPDAHLSVESLYGWEHGEVPLLCPDDTARPLHGGQEVAALRTVDGERCGSGIVSARLGEGTAWIYGYDLCRTVATLRHGTGDVRERPAKDMGPLTGPRHIYGFFDLSDKLPRDVPVCDLHQDILRTLVLSALSDTVLPRLWHFPDGAPALWFVKGDGCGESGADVEVEVVEEYGAYLTFNRPPVSQYSGGLMRDWHERGHGITIEASLDDVTRPTVEHSGKMLRRSRTAEDLNENALPDIRANLEAHRDSFVRDTGLDMDTICIHGCQWSGHPMAEMVVDLGWYTPTHFISHDPRMRHDERYGPYMISTALPLRYFQHGVGVLDLWHMPAQWDESQTLGERDPADPKSTGRVGLSAEAYGEELTRFAEDAARRWHGCQIANFHPSYVAMPQDHPRASRLALEIGLEGARSAGCRFENQERWSRFSRARADVRLVDRWNEGGAVFLKMVSPGDLHGLTLLLPDPVTGVRVAETGEVLEVREVVLEVQKQRCVHLDLLSGTPRTLRLAHAETE